ncbi:MAG: hypothetical protein Q8P00_04225 [Dehalococcoidia bacterium]|nr:hypothetical protein [Dehalococcoidia bacterium]
MPFWDLRPDEAEKHSGEASRHRNPQNRDFDLKLAIHHMEEAIRWKPGEVKYREQMAGIYLDAPELAIVPGVNLGADLNKSARLALAQYGEILKIEPTLGMDYRWFLGVTRAYLCLGEDKDKVKERLTEAWVSAFTVSKKRRPEPKEMAPAAGTIAQLLENPEGFYLRRSQKESSDPILARKHLQQAVLYRGQGKLKEAQKELQEGKKLAPDLRWLYEALCELGR